MIRKPDAKRQADLLVRELAKEGLVLARGKALDLVAKLQGCRNWNVYCKAEKVEAVLAAGAPRVAKTPHYSVALPAKMADLSGHLSDVRLAVHLGHAKNRVTTLLTHRVGDQVYELRLCGQVRGELTDQAGRLYSFDSGRGIGRALLAALEDPNNRVDLHNNPWFEWIDGAGDPVGDVFADISMNAQDELNSLENMLNAD